jgi:hypothetical protein
MPLAWLGVGGGTTWLAEGNAQPWAKLPPLKRRRDPSIELNHQAAIKYYFATPHNPTEDVVLVPPSFRPSKTIVENRPVLHELHTPPTGPDPVEAPAIPDVQFRRMPVRHSGVVLPMELPQDDESTRRDRSQGSTTTMAIPVSLQQSSSTIVPRPNDLGLLSEGCGYDYHQENREPHKVVCGAQGKGAQKEVLQWTDESAGTTRVPKKRKVKTQQSHKVVYKGTLIPKMYTCIREFHITYM